MTATQLDSMQPLQLIQHAGDVPMSQDIFVAAKSTHLLSALKSKISLNLSVTFGLQKWGGGID